MGVGHVEIIHAKSLPTVIVFYFMYISHFYAEDSLHDILSLLYGSLTSCAPLTSMTWHHFMYVSHFYVSCSLHESIPLLCYFLTSC